MNALVDDRVVQSAEVSEQKHLRVSHDGFGVNVDRDHFLLLGIVHFCIGISEENLPEDRSILPDMSGPHG